MLPVNAGSVKDLIKDIEESLSSTQEDVESLKEAVKNTSETSAYNGIEAMNKRILDWGFTLGARSIGLLQQLVT